MKQKVETIFIGASQQHNSSTNIQGSTVTLLGETFYKIHHFDVIEPFFMSIVSSSDHWLFVASTGGISAGRVSPDQALFPYYTVDKITENNENTGNKAILLVRRAQRVSLWEPFSERGRGLYHIERNIYKNIASTMVVFEENNFDLGLTYRYAWRTCEKYGFFKTTWLINPSDSACQVELVDGIQNILPANVTMATQMAFSSLLEAYKRSELHAATGLGIFTLNSTLTDLAEPSESLLATTVAQVGLEPDHYLLSSTQLNTFRRGNAVITENEVRGRRGAYFVHVNFELAKGDERTWHLLADVSQDSAAIVQKIQELRETPSTMGQRIEKEWASDQMNLCEIVAKADGLQLSNDAICTAHHFANVMFNGMRGGIFSDQYWVRAADFREFVAVRNHNLLQEQAVFFATLPSQILVSDLQTRADATGAADLIRLSYTYLPLAFSRRHGDPSRPWNRFTIKIKQADGSLRLDYEGNWRDIFQNWEALAYAYPEFVESMISTFLNATTADGYNPYRITYQGVDWEVPEPGNPWANIGYWSDHQIIYLLKLMEISANMHPGRLQSFLDRPLFSYAHVPYRIKSYADLTQDPYNTILFDLELEQQIEARVRERGTDGKLISRPDGEILQTSLTEKILVLLLAKLANFVPEGGIWMNTQRPEWNDANNALVGKGLSVVTLCYLRRYIAFCQDLFGSSTLASASLSAEVHSFYAQVFNILKRFQPSLQGTFDDAQRRAMMDALGQAGSDYRLDFYQSGFSGALAQLEIPDLLAFLDLVQRYVEHSLRANQRSDDLYHGYNILHLKDNRASVSNLYEMLEGQVAILSSGLLSGEESLALLESLRNSPLYQADQHSYLLYPDREVPGFLEKNCLSPEQVRGIKLFSALVEAGDKTLVTQDIHGVYHFSGQLHNIKDVNRTLDSLQQNPRFADLITAETEKVRELFEVTFRHSEFTGRSSTFFAYEGLGSVYWHMVAKLLLAVQETILRTRDEANANALVEKYRDIRAGLGFNKSPQAYGAFPTDPYSHTPKGQGAKQPGMTGLVKEEILTRQVELGLSIEGGHLGFDFLLFDRSEFLTNPTMFAFWGVDGQPHQLEIPAGSLAYTICQVPVILCASSEKYIQVHRTDGSMLKVEGHVLDSASSRHIFQRDNRIHHLVVGVSPNEPFKQVA